MDSTKGKLVKKKILKTANRSNSKFIKQPTKRGMEIKVERQETSLKKQMTFRR